MLQINTRGGLGRLKSIGSDQIESMPKKSRRGKAGGAAARSREDEVDQQRPLKVGDHCAMHSLSGEAWNGTTGVVLGVDDDPGPNGRVVVSCAFGAAPAQMRKVKRRSLRRIKQALQP